MPVIEPVNKSYRFQTINKDFIYIGDPLATEFHPVLKLEAWQEECSLQLEFDDAEISAKQKSVKLEGAKVKWETPKFDFHFSALMEISPHELGGLEFEIVLKEKPISNVFTFSIQAKDLKFFYQPLLSPEEIEAGDKRPENVVGSYAVYHAKRTNIHASIEEAEKYKTGKAFHIFKPKATDATGKSVWCNLNIDEVKGTLTLTIPEDFLGTAIYPVVIDPTFGKTAIGASEGYVTANYKIGSRYTLSEAGNVTKITYYLYVDASGAQGRAAIYENTAQNRPSALKGQTNITSGLPTGFAWVDFNFATAVSLTAADWWLVAHVNLDYLNYKYDTAGSNSSDQADDAFADGFSDPWDGHSLGARAISVYATYTPGAVLKEVTDTLALSDTLLCNKTFAISDSVGLSDTPLRDWSPQISDSIALSDSILINKIFEILDVIALSEVVEVLIPLKEVTDSIGLTEEIKTDKTLLIEDLLSLTDAILRDKSFELTDTISLSELVEIIGVPILKEVLDSIGLSDQVKVYLGTYYDKPVIILDVGGIGIPIFKKEKLER